MTAFVLIHGGMHGGWCWEKIVPRLEAAGHRVWAPDLPGMGRKAAIPPSEVSLAVEGDYIAELIREIDEPVVLVGHSMGGVAISEAAERVPEHLIGLVYAAANLVPSGETMFGWMSHREKREFTIERSADGLTLLPNPDYATHLFYNTCSAEDVAAILPRLRPQPALPAEEPLQLTPERFGSVPRAYVECLQDNALPLKFQRFMTAHLPCDAVFTIDSDHSPFVCRPDEFTQVLLRAEAALRQVRQSSQIALAV